MVSKLLRFNAHFNTEEFCCGVCANRTQFPLDTAHPLDSLAMSTKYATLCTGDALLLI